MNSLQFQSLTCPQLITVSPNQNQFECTGKFHDLANDLAFFKFVYVYFSFQNPKYATNIKTKGIHFVRKNSNSHMRLKINDKMGEKNTAKQKKKMCKQQKRKIKKKKIRNKTFYNVCSKQITVSHKSQNSFIIFVFSFVCFFFRSVLFSNKIFVCLFVCLFIMVPFDIKSCLLFVALIK